ncbi:HemK2/MTQ2 family protein methyltransferase [Actinomadura miaoliensis]|uniref:HemK2/MTQ2 family protein methyltransferase n=1 Tax=Actinomadura miaoliensis TaxID=430685 RepID=UPI0031EC4464
MWMLRPPGVYRPQADTALLTEALRQATVPRGARVLDLCTGTGAVAVAAARETAGAVVAVDLSVRAVLATRVNARLRGARVRVHRGDLLAPVAGELFDVILANPPYVPSGRFPPPRHGRSRCWDAGPDGRALLDRICDQAPRHLAPGGTLLVAQSSVCGVDDTLRALRAAGLKTSVAARRREPFGPVMRSRTADLLARGAIRPGQDDEELVVIRADHTRPRG